MADADNIDQVEIPPEYRWLLDEPMERVLEYLPGPTAEIYRAIGDLRAALRFHSYFTGQPVYVGKLSVSLKRLQEKRIREEFDGSNYRHLARKYGMTMSHLYALLRPRDERAQPTLFEDL